MYNEHIQVKGLQNVYVFKAIFPGNCLSSCLMIQQLLDLLMYMFAKLKKIPSVCHYLTILILVKRVFTMGTTKCL